MSCLPSPSLWGLGYSSGGADILPYAFLASAPHTHQHELLGVWEATFHLEVHLAKRAHCRLVGEATDASQLDSLEFINQRGLSDLLGLLSSKLRSDYMLASPAPPCLREVVLSLTLSSLHAHALGYWRSMFLDSFRLPAVFSCRVQFG